MNRANGTGNDLFGLTLERNLLRTSLGAEHEAFSRGASAGHALRMIAGRGGVPGWDNSPARERKRDADKEGYGGGGWEGHGPYMQSKIAKLQEQHSGRVESRASEALGGLVVHVNGETEVPAEDLKALVCAHGGTYSQYRVKEVRPPSPARERSSPRGGRSSAQGGRSSPLQPASV